MIANGDTSEEKSCVECAQELYDMLKDKEFSEEILNNAMQLLKKVQNESKNLNNVSDKEEDEAEEEVEESEDEGEESEPDYEDMSTDDMRKQMGKKGIIQITVGGR